MRTTFAGTRLQALSFIFVRSFSACVVGRKRIHRPPAIRSRPYRRDRGGQPGPGFLRKENVTARSRRAARKGSAAPLRGPRPRCRCCRDGGRHHRRHWFAWAVNHGAALSVCSGLIALQTLSPAFQGSVPAAEPLGDRDSAWDDGVQTATTPVLKVCTTCHRRSWRIGPRALKRRPCGRPSTGSPNAPALKPGAKRSSWRPACNVKCPPAIPRRRRPDPDCTVRLGEIVGGVQLRPCPRPQTRHHRPPGHPGLHHRKRQRGVPAPNATSAPTRSTRSCSTTSAPP